MPLPSQVHRDAALEKISVAYKVEGLIANELATPVPVKHESDLYYVYSRDQLVVPETARANGSESNRADYSLSTATYRVDEHSLNELVTDRSRNNADAVLNLDVDATEHLSQLILMRQEIDLAALVGLSGAWANVTSLTSTFAWSANTTLSNPLLFVDSASTVVIRSSGMRPNVVLLDERTYRAVRTHVSVVERTRYVGIESADPKMLAAMFAVPKVLIASGIQNTGAEGTADATANSFIWTDLAWVGYVESAPGPKKPSALYNFVLNNAGSSVQVKRWRDDARAGDVIEASKLFDNVAPMSAAGYQIWDTVQ